MVWHRHFPSLMSSHHVHVVWTLIRRYIVVRYCAAAAVQNHFVYLNLSVVVNDTSFSGKARHIYKTCLQRTFSRNAERHDMVLSTDRSDWLRPRTVTGHWTQPSLAASPNAVSQLSAESGIETSFPALYFSHSIRDFQRTARMRHTACHIYVAYVN